MKYVCAVSDIECTHSYIRLINVSSSLLSLQVKPAHLSSGVEWINVIVKSPFFLRIA